MRNSILVPVFALALAATSFALSAQEADPSLAPDPAAIGGSAADLVDPADTQTGAGADLAPQTSEPEQPGMVTELEITEAGFEEAVIDEEGSGLSEIDPSDPLSSEGGLEVSGVPTGLGHDLSPWGMFLAADWVVKAVMVGLAFAVFITGVIWVAKSFEIIGANARARMALKAVTGSAGLLDAIRALEGKRGAGVVLIRAAEEEVRLSYDAIDDAGGDGLKERVNSRLSRLVGAAGQRLSRGTGILATIGSTAPFVGLFGTVWGIMNSFIGIAETQTTNLAVVAPGIAEALLATAIGLVAAIPAVVVYNMFARAITAYRRLLGDTSSGIERLISRDLDYRKVLDPSAQPSLRHRNAAPERASNAEYARPDGFDGVAGAETR